MKLIYFITLCYGLLNFYNLNSQTGIKLNSGDKDVSITYPVPPANKNMLFYLQRTHNVNTIIYELNYNKDSSINEKEPVKAYWIRYTEGSIIAPLSAIQKSFAYGISSALINKEKRWFKINLNAYKKTEIYLMNTKNDKTYHAFVKINESLMVINRIFFQTDGGTFWNPNVVSVELTGKDINTGKTIIEKFKPIR